VAVVESDAPQWVEKLKAIHAELIGPGKTDPLSPIRLEVIDRATDDAIQRLMAAGLICKTTRSSRPLLTSDNPSETSPLSSEELSKARSFRESGARKLKMARLLGEGGFVDELRPAMTEAIHAFGRALAVEGRLPEPGAPEKAIEPPLSHLWADALPALRAFMKEPGADWKQPAECLGRL
jgi:hypothetical protein